MEYRPEKIRSAQAAKNWTDDELAAQAGLGRTTVNQITNGKLNDPRLSTVLAISRALELPITEIVVEVKAA